MRIILALLVIILIAKPVFSQTPSKKEMQEQMQQIAKELNNQIVELEKQIAEAKKNKEDAETIKELEGQLAMLKKQAETMRTMGKGVSNMSDRTFQQAANEYNNEDVPKRDINRIKTLPEKVLTHAELAIFVKNITAEVERKISPEQLKQAQAIYKTAKEKKLEAGIGNFASLCWMNGYTELALYFAGKACLVDMKNPDNLNNFAAFLSMTGGEHLALPILENLNQQFPGNSTVLNNMGQAWHGLGETNNAKKYLNDAMHAYALHPQANRTIGRIQKSEGRTQESIESLKRAIKESFDPDIEAEIENLGGKLKYEDVPFRYPGKAEQLGVERFFLSIPAYPFIGGEAASSSWMEWSDFKEKVMAAKEAVGIKLKILNARVEAYTKRVVADQSLLQPYNNKVHITARRKSLLLIEWYHDRLALMNSDFVDAANLIAQYRNEFEQAMKTLKDCGARKNAATTFLSKANLLHQQVSSKVQLLHKEFINAEAWLALYTSTDRSLYELEIEKIKEGVLIALYGLPAEFEVGCVPTEAPPREYTRQLPDFDEKYCQYKTELSIPFMEKTFSIKLECNKMTTKFDLPFVSAEIQENLNTNKLIEVVKGSVEFSQGFSKDIPLNGPLSAEMEMKIGAFVEFNSSGITDVGIQGTVSATASTTNLDKSIEMEDGSKYSVPGVGEQKLELGVSVRSSWNAGTTVSGTGLFGGSKVSFK